MAESGPLGIVADIGGTNARFACALRRADGKVAIAHEQKYRTADYPSFEAAYRHYAASIDMQAAHGVFALAGPVGREEVKLTNSPWVLRPAGLAERLGLESARLINDFEAIATAVGAFGPEDFRRLDGGAFELPSDGVVSIVGPGSGLGVASIHFSGGQPRVVPCEGGHVGFAPADEVDIQMLRFLLGRYPRVSAERFVSGPGLVQIHIALANLENRAIVPPEQVSLWEAAQSGQDLHAFASMERWLMLLGTVAGDIALAQGAGAVVLAGGILPRIGDKLDTGLLLSRFRAKGRFETMMHAIPVAMINHPEPGLFGAATVLAAA
ncbi:glucokinase [Sphingomonas sp. BIUV-7]|uniref:Glucokinase n=1 Tax=Sphingomonas natans TaxID=3063330 RepID=A0ABT8Y9I0_9SPHN|nr:glucokinase [Sphingomonas sp. BIUV-7]MDO6414994.1 glucokinase [Sphingomonas sp. BIUV-7]